jgi:hypothetical protein
MTRTDKRANSHRGKIGDCRILVKALQIGGGSLPGKNGCAMISTKSGGAAQ